MNTAELTARQIMTPEVISVQVEDTVQEAAQLLLDARITGAPVVDRWGNAVGVFTLANACEYTNGQNDGQNGPSKSGQAQLEADDEAYYRIDLRRRWPTPLTVEEPMKHKKVGDVMTPRVHSVLDASPLTEVTSCILDRGIHRIFVRDADNKLVGIITSMDLLRVLADVLDGKLVA
jgi:CBS-domain-containing membrane protein